jgi:hypothetical protein
MIIWDILEVEDRLFSEAVFTFDNDCPKDVAEGLRQSQY